MNTLRLLRRVPLAASVVLERLARHRHSSLVVASDPQDARPGQPEYVIFFSVRGECLKRITDVWLAPGAREEIIEALAPRQDISIARCSTPSHGACIVWAVRDGALCLWRRGRLVGRFRADETALRRFHLGPWRTFSNSDFSHTRGFLSDSWLRRGVCLERRDARVMPIIHSMDFIVLLDPTYPGPELNHDAGWVRELAREISVATTLPLKLDPPLA